jgi:shikimate kinase
MKALRQQIARGQKKCTDRIDRPVVLVGLMGVGKTTVGRRLAKCLSLGFVDADQEIERAADMSVAEIFARFGEDYFRDGERRVIARLLDEAPQVIATGGGAFINDDTRALILAKGIAVWLDADIEILIDRVSRRDTRPLLKTGDPATIMRELAAKRSPIYAQAHHHVLSNDAPHEKTVDSILAVLQA